MELSDIPKSLNFLLKFYSLAYMIGFGMDPVMFFIYNFEIFQRSEKGLADLKFCKSFFLFRCKIRGELTPDPDLN